MAKHKKAHPASAVLRDVIKKRIKSKLAGETTYQDPDLIYRTHSRGPSGPPAWSPVDHGQGYASGL